MEEKGKKMANLSRRDFIKAALASSALYAVGGSSHGWAATANGSGPIPPGNGPFDVAIIGAGMAGLAAAQTLLAAGRTNIVVLEAQNHWGGRARSINNFMKFPVDLGAEWFQFVAPNITGGPGTNNPLFDLAFDNGRGVKRLGLFPDLVLRAFYKGSQPASLEESLEPSLMLANLTDAINQQGQLTTQDPLRHPDVSASQAVQPYAGQKWFDFGVGTLTAEHGPTLQQLGCLDLLQSLAPR